MILCECPWPEGKLDQAIEAYGEALRISPQHADLRRCLDAAPDQRAASGRE